MILDPDSHESYMLADAESIHTDRPAEWYEPHAFYDRGPRRGQISGQRQFHEANHIVRALFPGNRWGKTTALGVEVNCCVRHDGHWNTHWSNIKHPTQVMWFCVDFGQFDLLRPQLEGKCFERTWKYNANDNFYEWPGGDRLWIKSDVRDWTYIQGTNPDLIVVDEQCPLGLWRELAARGYGDRDTKYIVGATATDMAGSWMEREIYLPWKTLHLERGYTEEQALVEQMHPKIWCMPRGGIDANPSISDAKVAGFKALTWASDKEKKVRDEGGFETSVGDPVFDPDGVEWLRQRLLQLDQELGQGRRGFFEVIDKA